MNTETDARPELEMEKPVGLEIAPGRFKTASGTIVVPKARQKKLLEKAAKKNPDSVPDFVTATEVQAPVPPRTREESMQPQEQNRVTEKISFKTPMGLMTAQYAPVIDLPEWVVLGLTPQSFVPVSYKENKELSFEVEGESVKKCKVVFTGCKFTDTATKSSYIIMMKV